MGGAIVRSAAFFYTKVIKCVGGVFGDGDLLPF